jgi:hypothetical protein
VDTYAVIVHGNAYHKAFFVPNNAEICADGVFGKQKTRQKVNEE